MSRDMGLGHLDGMEALLAVMLRSCAVVAVACLFLHPGVAFAQSHDERAPIVSLRVEQTLPHDAQAFTQGLFFDRGRLYETTGMRGGSQLRELHPEDGRVLRFMALPRRYFGEGATAAGGGALWLTWTSGRAFAVDLGDFSRREAFAYPGEGWGLTGDGERLFMSDGSAVLTVRDPATFAEVGRIEVRDGQEPVARLNELEWVEGEIFANVWLTSRIAVIDPATGLVRRWLDLAPLVPPGLTPDAVANGIAWNSVARRLYVTGKLWPVMYVVSPDHKQ